MKTQGMWAYVAVVGLLAASGCTFSGAVTGTSGAGQAQATGDAQPSTAGAAAQTKVPVSVRLIPDSLVIPVGNAKDLTVTVTYSDGTFDSNATWSSSDDTILAVNSTTGKVSAVKAGTASIVATSIMDPSKKAIATITVRPPDVTEAITTVTPSEATLKVGQTQRLEAKIQLSDGSISPNVVWSTDNQQVAIVTNGLVTAVGPGETTITATASGDSTKKASAKVTVEAE